LRVTIYLSLILWNQSHTFYRLEKTYLLSFVLNVKVQFIVNFYNFPHGKSFKIIVSGSCGNIAFFFVSINILLVWFQNRNTYYCFLFIKQLNSKIINIHQYASLSILLYISFAFLLDIKNLKILELPIHTLAHIFHIIQ